MPDLRRLNRKAFLLSVAVMSLVVSDGEAGPGQLRYSEPVLDVLLPVLSFTEADRHQYLPRTMAALEGGEPLKIVMLGDSIVRDTFFSHWTRLLPETYPQLRIETILSVRESTGMWWYREEDRLQSYVHDYSPDLVMIGGISHRGDLDAVRDVVSQIRAGGNAEILLMSDAANLVVVPESQPEWMLPTAGGSWRDQLWELAAEEQTAFVDLRGPWNSYLYRAHQLDPSIGYTYMQRDGIHMNPAGRLVVAKTLEAFFTPDPVLDPDFNRDGNVDGDDFLIWQDGATRFPAARATRSEGNFTREGLVDGDDFLIWQSSFNPGILFASISDGDFSGDGFVGGEDFLLWQTGFTNYQHGGGTPADGDANGDGLVDGDDFLIWQDGATRFPNLSYNPAGDTNGDRIVDGDDFLVWQQNFGQFHVGALHSDGDADHNRIVDGDDFLIWQSFVEGASGGASASAAGLAVPEPTTAVLLLISLVLVSGSVVR